MARQRLDISDIVDLIDTGSVREAGEALHLLVENDVANTWEVIPGCLCLFCRQGATSVDDDVLH